MSSEGSDCVTEMLPGDPSPLPSLFSRVSVWPKLVYNKDILEKI